MNARPNFIDYSKVLCMFLVIYGHYIPYLGLDMGDNFLWHTVHVINLFHMPLFFIISGILFKESTLSNIFVKGIKRIMIPYIIIALICLIIGCGYKFLTEGITLRYIAYNIIGVLSGSDIFGKGYMDYSGPLWFCYALFFIYLCINILLKFNSRGGI